MLCFPSLLVSSKTVKGRRETDAAYTFVVLSIRKFHATKQCKIKCSLQHSASVPLNGSMTGKDNFKSAEAGTIAKLMHMTCIMYYITLYIKSAPEF